MESYLKAHPYLKETAELYLAMGKAIKAAAKPLAFPARKALAELAKGAFPVLQQFELQAETVRTAASTLPAALAALARIPAPSKMQDALAAWAIWAKRAKAEERQAFFDNLLRQEDQEIRDFASREKLSEPILRTVGWAILAALVSAVTEKPLRQDVAVTGEISLAGRIRPVGGVFEKAYGARQAGIRTLVIPKENETDIPNDLLGLDIHPVETAEQAFSLIFEESPIKSEEA